MPAHNSPSAEHQVLDRRKRKRWQVSNLLQMVSIYQWTLLIFFVVTLPLILTLIYSVKSIQDYTDRSHATLFQTVRVSENNEALLNHLLVMDRSIRQYQILEDVAIFNVFQNNHQRFIEIAARTSQFQIPRTIQQLLAKLIQNELRVYDQILAIKDLQTEKLSAEDITEYVQLRTEAQALVSKGNSQIYIETESLSALAILVRNQVTYSALVSVLLAFLLGLLLLYLINKPIKSIARAIHKLGNAQVNERIYIEGPKDLREVGQQLEWLRQRLNQLDNSKQFFIKTISHELKTPLATIMEGADLLQDEVVGELNAEQHKIIELLQIANIRLNSLIENLIEYQKAGSTLATMNYAKFNLNQLLKHICVEYQLLLDSKQVSIDFTAKSIDFVADRDKMRIIISNLISNALKFSPQGGQIKIELQTTHNKLQILIADQGPGIAKNHQAHIFSEFYKQPIPESWKIKSSGLGLSLVKDYVMAHRGQVRILESDSEYSGAHFLVILPLTPRHLTAEKL
ncbi:sensor histidine kinase [Methyloprofundus sp.]|uniref:sensor histidine kinase n=1 Tax=Methyloprofundus sp. TaxID=2020875 RepID=UPI003D10D4E1